jgi:metacaspase-1
MIKKLLLLFIFTLLFSVQLTLSYAENRALLIGVGEYKNNVKKLPGVIFDIESMRDSAHILGFKEENIKVILNQEATIKNVRNTISNWLIKGTNVEDKVLIYFSGHGSRIPDTNGDELDGADEVLILYDTEIVSKNKKSSLNNILVDDELNQYLQQIRSHDIMLLVDACNSGTVYRGVSFQEKDKVYGKFFNYYGIPTTKSINEEELLSEMYSSDKRAEISFKNLSVIDKNDNTSSENSVITEADNFRFVAFTAAGDNELALATKKGSLFTQGINYYLKLAAINQQQITPQQLIEKVTLYIQNKIEEDNLGAVYQPHLAGNHELFHKFFSFVDSPLAKVNWNRLEELDSSAQKLVLHSSKSNLILGENLTIDIEIPHQGYLNVISVGPDDEVFVLYPNYWDKNNLVKPGVVHLPTKKMNFQIKLTEPLGTNLMVAILTTQAINLFEQSVDGRDKSGQMFSSLKEVLKSSNKSTNIKDKAYLSGKLLVEVH